MAAISDDMKKALAQAKAQGVTQTSLSAGRAEPLNRPLVEARIDPVVANRDTKSLPAYDTAASKAMREAGIKQRMEDNRLRYEQQQKQRDIKAPGE